MKWMLVLIGLVFSCSGAAAQPQPFPQKPVKIVVPYPPGGMDILYRALAVELSNKWGQPVIVENRAGADSRIGAEAVAKAAPDGYTILATGDFTFVANRFLFAKLPYDPDSIDLFFIVLGDGSIYVVPSAILAGRTSISAESYTAYRVGDASSLLRSGAPVAVGAPRRVSAYAREFVGSRFRTDPKVFAFDVYSGGQAV